MSVVEILTIIFVHWFADFLMQDEKWAIGKSKNNQDLTMHVLMYSTIWFLVANTYIIGFKANELLYLFAPITFICHWVTDYFTSRIVSKKFANNEYGSPIPNIGAFTIIGTDQFLHYAQLFITYQLLK